MREGEGRAGECELAGPEMELREIGKLRTCDEAILSFLFFFIFILVDVSLDIEELVAGRAPSPLLASSE